MADGWVVVTVGKVSLKQPFQPEEPAGALVTSPKGELSKPSSNLRLVKTQDVAGTKCLLNMMLSAI